MTIHGNKIVMANASYYRTAYKYNSISKINESGKMHGAKRVATFCILTAVLPTLLIIIPLYLRHSVFADVLYEVAESDVIEIREGISTIFCQEHVLSMNSTFNAYQFSDTPNTNSGRKRIQLKKSMVLPDDTLEYWGFYLLSGATVELKACSRFEGAKIMVVRGERNLRTCGLLDHNKNKIGPNMDKEYRQVQVVLNTHAQEILRNKNTHNFDENTGSEDLREDDELEKLKKIADSYIKKHSQKKNITKKHKRHMQRRILEQELNENIGKTPSNCKNKNCQTVKNQDNDKNVLIQPLNNNINNCNTLNCQKQNEQVTSTNCKNDCQNQSNVEKIVNVRQKRETSHKIDGGIEHGGTAINYTEEESSFSSFESDLHICYDGFILLTQGFPPSQSCTNITYLENKTGDMKVVHDVSSDGYYYYIFYSDNDISKNEIHAIFNISKPTFQYINISKSRECINSTECSFQVTFASDETVVVEVPTRDGIEHEDDDITILVSKCKPRMAIYIIFPITILFLILGCAFL